MKDWRIVKKNQVLLLVSEHQASLLRAGGRRAMHGGGELLGLSPLRPRHSQAKETQWFPGGFWPKPRIPPEIKKC